MSNTDWLADNMKDPGFRRWLERVEFTEGFLNQIDNEMEKQGITRAELARRMGRRPTNITQIMNGIRSLMLTTMVDMAFHLGLKLNISMEVIEGGDE